MKLKSLHTPDMGFTYISTPCTDIVNQNSEPMVERSQHSFIYTIIDPTIHIIWQLSLMLDILKTLMLDILKTLAVHTNNPSLNSKTLQTSGMVSSMCRMPGENCSPMTYFSK